MMSTSLRMDRIHFQNFRCFTECSVDLHEALTVLVAENGSGKTALLDGIAIALGSFVDGLRGAGRLYRINQSDIRFARATSGEMTPVLPMTLKAEGQIGARTVEWGRAVRTYSRHPRTSQKGLEALLAITYEMRSSLGRSVIPVTLPLVAFYGTGRLWWSEHKLTESDANLPSDEHPRLAGYTGWLASSSSFKRFVDWFESTTDNIADPRFARELSLNIPLVTAVQEAVRVALEPTGWRGLNWDRKARSLMVEHATQGRLPFMALSDGTRNMAAMVADLARRCATLNPHFGEEAALRTPGVVLIDEIDLHLHPRWQQLVVSLMQRAFPRLQIILSTHSPHVLSTVDKESIRTIGFVGDRCTIMTPYFQTKGVISADVLATIMEVDPVPQTQEAEWLSRYRALIEDGEADGPEAEELRAELIAHFGSGHPVMVGCDQLIRFQAYRLKRRPSGDRE